MEEIQTTLATGSNSEASLAQLYYHYYFSNDSLTLQGNATVST